MAIEFRCVNCGKLLRTADATAGKQAKCPECGAIMSVPASSAGASGAGPSGMAPPPPPSSPFGAPPAASPSPGAENPYQSPTAPLTQSPFAATATAGDIRHTIIDVGSIFSRSWAIFRETWGPCLIALILVMAINFGFNFVVGLMNGIAGAIAQNQAISVGLSLLGQLITILFGTWLGIGQAIFFLRTARGQNAAVGDIFTGGPYFLRVMLAQILLWLIVVGVILVVVGIPVLIGMAISQDATAILAVLGGSVAAVVLTYIMLTISQFYYLILDRNLGPFESLQKSAELMEGNRITLLLIGLASSGIILVAMIPCCLGLLVAIPYLALMYPVIYLSITGQPTAADYATPSQPMR